LDSDSILQRIAQFQGKYDIVISNAPTFDQKARLFPNTTFVLGLVLGDLLCSISRNAQRLIAHLLDEQDTAVRVAERRYYGAGTQADLVEAMQHIQRCNCRFVVGGRVLNGKFRTGHDYDVRVVICCLAIDFES